MKNLMYTLIFLLILANFSLAIPVVVYISDDVDGHSINTSRSVDGRVLNLKTIWENTGSASCKIYSLLIISPQDINETDTHIQKYYSWSNPKDSYPGSTAILNNMWFIPSNKTYHVEQYIYFCRQKRRINDFVWNFSNISMNYTSNFTQYYNVTLIPINKTSFETKIIINQSLLNTKFTDNYSLNIYIIPAKFPSYWNIDSKKYIINNTTTEINDIIQYNPELWFNQNLEFVVADNQGNFKRIIVSNNPKNQSDFFEKIKYYITHLSLIQLLKYLIYIFLGILIYILLKKTYILIKQKYIITIKI